MSRTQVRALLALSLGSPLPHARLQECDFFAIRRVEGETLESILDKLVRGDPAYLSRYSVEARIQVALGVVHALEYAHAEGIVHRNVKPANVMVGPYGEVVLMDKAIGEPVVAVGDAPPAGIGGEVGGDWARQYLLQAVSLISTAAYQSPEQARGEVDKVDARSDVYSTIVLLHELMGLKHYLSDKKSVHAMRIAVAGERFGFSRLLHLKYPRERPRRELVHLVVKGLDKDPDKRFQSAAELRAALVAILEGRIRVQCHVTLTKRVLRELARFVDRAPFFGFAALLGLSALVVFALVRLVLLAIT